jgi:hypothetical protein
MTTYAEVQAAHYAYVAAVTARAKGNATEADVAAAEALYGDVDLAFRAAAMERSLERTARVTRQRRRHEIETREANAEINDYLLTMTETYY